LLERLGFKTVRGASASYGSSRDGGRPRLVRLRLLYTTSSKKNEKNDLSSFWSLTSKKKVVITKGTSDNFVRDSGTSKKDMVLLYGSFYNKKIVYLT
jgi:hypothetical protein